MDLTLDQVATKRGITVRQVRYLVQKGSLKAQKKGKVWVVKEEDLPPPSPGQAQHQERKLDALRDAVDEVLGPPEQKRYSVGDLKAFQVAAPVFRDVLSRFGSDHPATLALRRSLHALAQGCHRFHGEAKALSYEGARDAASEAVCELLLLGGEEAGPWVAALENGFMPAVAGLVRRAEKRGRR